MEPLLNGWIILGGTRGFKQVKVCSISHILCEDYLCVLHLIDKETITCSKSLRYCEQVLLPYPFARIHHNALVCLSQVKEVRCHGRQRHSIMNDGTALSISVRRWPAFRDALHANTLVASYGIDTCKTDTLTK